MGLFEEYCGSSTVHGVRYFGEKKRHWLERCVSNVFLEELIDHKLFLLKGFGG